MINEQIEYMKAAADGASLVIMLGAVTSALPAIAAGLSIVWTAIRIYETDTFKRFLAKVRSKF